MVITQRITVANEQALVVFLIGMRVNKVWRVHKWSPVATAMTRMLNELKQHPEMGFLGAEVTLNFPTTFMIQYWRSFEDLALYAGNKDAVHLPAWREFNRQVGSNGDVGIWHETYSIPAVHYEAIYNNMPEFGLGKILPLVPAIGQRESARARITAHSKTERVPT